MIFNTGEEARRYDWFCDQHRKATMVSEIGAVRQIVAPGRLVSEFETSVAAAPMRVGGSMPVTIFGSIVSSADITATTETPRGLEKTLEMDPEFLNTDGEHEHDTSVSGAAGGKWPPPCLTTPPHLPPWTV